MFNQVLMLARVTAGLAVGLAVLATATLRLARLAATRATLRLAAGLTAATVLLRATTRHAAGAAAANLLFQCWCIYLIHLLYFNQRLFFTQIEIDPYLFQTKFSLRPCFQNR